MNCSNSNLNSNREYEDGYIFYAGWLNKQGGKFKTMKKRYFVVKSDCMNYFKNEKMEKITGTIPLVSAAITKDKKGSGMKIITTARTFYLVGESEANTDAWILALRKAVSINSMKKTTKTKAIAPVRLTPLDALINANASSEECSSPKGNGSTPRTSDGSNPPPPPPPPSDALKNSISPRTMNSFGPKSTNGISSTSATNNNNNNNNNIIISPSRLSGITSPNTPSSTGSTDSMRKRAETRLGNKKAIFGSTTNSNGLCLSEADEYGLAMAATSIFIKQPLYRTPQEQAYVIALENYQTIMQYYCAKFKTQPRYGLATGTAIFTKDPNCRSPEEQMYINNIAEEYIDILKTYAETLYNFSIEEQEEILVGAIKIFSKPDHERTPEEKEYVCELETYLHGVKQAEIETGLVANLNLISATSTLAKYPEEQKPWEGTRDIYLLLQNDRLE